MIRSVDDLTNAKTGRDAGASNQLVFPVLVTKQTDRNPEGVLPTSSSAPDSALGQLLSDKWREWEGSERGEPDFDDELEILASSDMSQEDWDELGLDNDEGAETESMLSVDDHTPAEGERSRHDAVVTPNHREGYTDGKSFQRLGESPNPGNPLPNLDKAEAPNGSAVVDLMAVGRHARDPENQSFSDELDVQSVRAESQYSLASASNDWVVAGAPTGTIDPSDASVNDRMRELDETMAGQSQTLTTGTTAQSIINWNDDVKHQCVCEKQGTISNEDQEISPDSKPPRSPASEGGIELTPAQDATDLQPPAQPRRHEQGVQTTESTVAQLDPQALGSAIAASLSLTLSELFATRIQALTQRQTESEEELRGMIKTLAEKVGHLESAATQAKETHERGKHTPSRNWGGDTALPSLSTARRAAIRREMAQTGRSTALPTETIHPSSMGSPSKTATEAFQTTVMPDQPQLSSASRSWGTPVSSSPSVSFNPPQPSSHAFPTAMQSINYAPASAPDTSELVCPHGCPTCTAGTRRGPGVDRSPSIDRAFQKLLPRRRRPRTEPRMSISRNRGRLSIDSNSDLGIRLSYR